MVPGPCGIVVPFFGGVEDKGADKKEREGGPELCFSEQEGVTRLLLVTVALGGGTGLNLS